MVIQESQKKGLNDNYKKTACKVASKMDKPRCELQTRAIKQVQKFKYEEVKARAAAIKCTSPSSPLRIVPQDNSLVDSSIDFANFVTQ